MNPFEKYKTAVAYTSNPKNQMIFVFDEILRLLYKAKKAIGEKDYEKKYKTLIAAINVFYLLKDGVNQASSDENHKAIERFYGATIDQLENINLRAQEPEEVDIIINAIIEIREALVVKESPKGN